MSGETLPKTTCPTCGGAVRVVSSDEGTSHYQPAPAPTVDAPSKPPIPWATVNTLAKDRGLWDTVSEALIGKFSPSRRDLLVGNIVIAISRWREMFRDCGCWKKADGFALCQWHERLFAPQRAEALRAALSAPAPTVDAAALLGRLVDAVLAYSPRYNHDWRCEYRTADMGWQPGMPPVIRCECGFDALEAALYEARAALRASAPGDEG